MNRKLSATHALLGYLFRLCSRFFEIISIVSFLGKSSWYESWLHIRRLVGSCRHWFSVGNLSDSNFSLTVSLLNATTPWCRISLSCNYPSWDFCKLSQSSYIGFYAFWCFRRWNFWDSCFVRFTYKKFLNFFSYHDFKFHFVFVTAVVNVVSLFLNNC